MSGWTSWVRSWSGSISGWIGWTQYPRRWLYVGLLLGVLLIVAQVGTPFLNAALIHLGP